MHTKHVDVAYNVNSKSAVIDNIGLGEALIALKPSYSSENLT